jgi:tetratricopeptide (TPR) repeat protein
MFDRTYAVGLAAISGMAVASAGRCQMNNRIVRWSVVVLVAAAAPLSAADATARQLMDNGHYKRARAALETRLQSTPDDSEGLCLMSQLKLLSGEREAAMQLAERAVKLDGKNPLTHLQLVKVLADAVDRAGGLHQIKLGHQLKSELEVTLSLDPANVDALKFQELIYRNAPAIFGGDKNKARQLVDKITQIDPVQGYFLQAQIAGNQKQNGQVEEFYRKAVEANPNSYQARIRLAYYCLRGSKKFTDAETQAREALRLNADRIDAYEVLAAVLAFQKKWEELDAMLAKAQAAVPDNLRPYFSVGVQLVTEGLELPRAERYLRKYLSQEPELAAPSHAMAHWRLGQALEKEGRAGEAVSEYQAALKQDSASPAKRDLERLQSRSSQPAYEPAQHSELVRNITAGADSLERAQAIALQLARLRIPYESRPFELADKTGTNIIASLPAPNPGAPGIMLGAHLDRVAEGKGAIDNASGAAAVLELLAAFKRSPLQNYRIAGAFWDREEDGLLGSRAFVSSQPHDQLPSIYINFDMVAYGDILLANWKDEKSRGAEAFRKSASDQFPLRWDFRFPPSDDRSFIAAGVEVVALALAADKQDIENGLKLQRGEDAPPTRALTIMHTAEDTPDKVRAADVCRVLPVIERAIRLVSEAQ